MIKRLFLSLLGSIGLVSLGANSYAIELQNLEYFYFYGQGCSHCIKVEHYFEQSKMDKKIQISAYEIWNNPEGLQKLEALLPKVNLSLEEIGTPFLIIKSADDQYSSLMGDTPIINYFKKLEEENAWHKSEGRRTRRENNGSASRLRNSTSREFLKNNETPPLNKDTNPQKIENWNLKENNLTWDVENLETWEGKKSLAEQPLKFLAVMMPAALADSINPCAFAVMLLLLATILSKSQSKKKTIFAGIFFCLAVFWSYFLMGLWVYSLLWQSEWESYTFTFKRVVGILWLLVGLANLKDYFWYGKGFVMEVPRAWRPRMMKIIQAVVSPRGAFVIGIVVSLFLLPCSSGPYLVILGLLRSESTSLTQLGVGYLALYNFIFILPMLVITFLVGLGYSSVEKLAKIKNKNTKLIHLIVGLLMIGLGVYVIGSLYW